MSTPRPPGPRVRLSLLLRGLCLAFVAGCGRGGATYSTDSLVVVETSTLPQGATGAFYDAVVVARGPHPPFAWRAQSGMLPDGVALDGDTGRLSGWPRRAGTFRFAVEVRDGADDARERDVVVASDVRRFEVRVERGAVTVLPFPVLPLPYGVPARHRFEAAGGAGLHRFEVSGGRLPLGLALETNGVLSGTPVEAANPYLVRVRALDAAGAAGERDFPLEVVVPPLAVATKDLPDAALSFPYDQTPTLRPAGAGPPFAWSVSPGPFSLPPGLEIEAGTGRLRGAATAVGTFVFRLEVADATGQTAGRDLSIRVNPGPVLEAVVPGTLPRSGAPVTLVGQGFQPGMTVAFGIAAPLAVDVLDTTRATAVPPVPPSVPLQSGPVAVRVRNEDGGEHERASAFRYPLATVEFVAQGVRGTGRGQSRGLAAGDLDGDGLCDLVHAGSQGIETIRPVGPPYSDLWTTNVVRSDGSFDDVRVADLDSDGDLDLVLTRSATSGESLEAYLNDRGTGGFPSVASVVTPYAKPPSHHNPHTLAVGEVDGDGIPDVAFTSSRGNQGVVYVFRGLGNGAFAAVATALDTVWNAEGGLWGANAVALADLDGDGRDDVVVTDTFPSACAPGQSCPGTPAPDAHPGSSLFAAWVALCGPGGVPGPWRPVLTGPASSRLDGDNEGLAVLDEDGDGRLDVAVFGGFQDLRGMGLGLFRGDGTGTLTERIVIATAYDRRFGARIDANLDGCDDWVVVGGDGTSLTPFGSDLSVAECWLGGLPVPVRAWTSGPEDLPGGSIPGSNPGRVAVGDFDGDGLEDFAVDQSFHVKERSSNDQGPGRVEGVAVYLSRCR